MREERRAQAPLPLAGRRPVPLTLEQTMQPPKEPAKVVGLPPRSAQGVSDRAVEILRDCRGLAQKQLGAFVGQLFDNVDDALFELAERSAGLGSQQMYFDGMREVRKKRHWSEQFFQDTLRDSFAALSEGRLPKAVGKNPSSGAESPEGDLKLALVDNEELEQSLARSSMVSKAQNRLARALFALNQRLSVLAGGLKIDDDTNPVGPAQLADGFGEAVAGMDTSLEVRLIVLKLFERYVLNRLDAVYEELNQLLVQAGVLPQLKHTPSVAAGQVLRGPAAPGATASGGAAAASVGAGVPKAAGAAAEPISSFAGGDVQHELLNTLHRLLAQRHGLSAYVPPPAATVDTEALLGALAAVQASYAQTPWTPTTSAESVTLSAEQLKQLLLRQAAPADRGEPGKEHVKRDDEDAIELVSMLFEFIAKDRNIPPTIQAQLGRLQIPYVKVALLDRHLFAQKSHPARRLLDELAQLAVGWSAESDRDGAVLAQIRNVVERVLTEFGADMAFFARLHEDLVAFMQAQKRRAEIAEQRAAEAARGKEKLLAARKRAADVIESRLESVKVPELVESLLKRPWANALVLIQLRQGEDSDEFRAALKFVDDLIWSSQPKTTEAERARLRELLPELGKVLRKGLTMVAYQEADIRRVLADLTAYYRQLLGSAKPATASTDAAAEAVDAATQTQPTPRTTEDEDADSGFEIISPAGIAAPASPIPAQLDLPSVDAFRTEPEAVSAVSVDRSFIERARALKVGTWVEFIDRDGRSERAKLSWISPISSKYLFVNRRGLKVADKTIYELAVDLRDGRAELLETVPLFDRAMDAIVERLKSSPEPARPPAQAAQAQPDGKDQEAGR